MTITSPVYCTREQVQQALDQSGTAREADRVDRAVEAGAGDVEGATLRRFYPWTGTRRVDWPNDQYAAPWRLWLGPNELISLATLVSGGTTIPASGYFLRRSDQRDEPPYTHIEVDIAGQYAFSSAGTHQRSAVLTGVFGACADEAPAGALAEALDDTETGVDVTDSAAIGVGQIIRVGDERMIVSDKAMLTTGQTLQSALAASASAVTVAVTSGAGFTVGETLLLDSERMLVVDIAANNLTVRRAYDGTVLAAHTAPTIYAARTLTVVRGALGTTATAHDTTTAVVRHAPPPLVTSLNLAYAINQLLQEQAGYARVAGSGENAREFTGRGIAALEADVCRRYGRQARVAAI